MSDDGTIEEEHASVASEKIDDTDASPDTLFVRSQIDKVIRVTISDGRKITGRLQVWSAQSICMLLLFFLLFFFSCDKMASTSFVIVAAALSQCLDKQLNLILTEAEEENLIEAAGPSCTHACMLVGCCCLLYTSPSPRDRG